MSVAKPREQESGRPSIQKLAREQGVRPVERFEDLLGGWPDKIDDGFEAAVARWRGHVPDEEEA